MCYLTNCRSCQLRTKRTLLQPWTLRVFKLDELVKATNSFSRENVLGQGSHARVYKAVLEGGEVVAVKRATIRPRNAQDVCPFNSELDVLSKLQDRHLVNLIGYCNESPEKLLVLEFMGNGTLFDLLHSNTKPLSWPLRVRMAYQAAKGILALHSASPPLIHRDIKSSNILVDYNWNAKLGDLGLALHGPLENLVRHRTLPAGTMGYIDPGYETPSQLSTKSDVFSFGILLLEILSGRNAIDVRYNPSSIVDWAVPLIRQRKSLALCDPTLERPRNTTALQQLAAIAARSVRFSSDKRPTMAEVVEGLRRIRRKLPVPRFSGTAARTSTTPVFINEVSEEFSDGASSSKFWAPFLIGEGSVLDEWNGPSSDSTESSDSVISIRRYIPMASSSLRILNDAGSRELPSLATQAIRKAKHFMSNLNSSSFSSSSSKQPKMDLEVDPTSRTWKEPVSRIARWSGHLLQDISRLPLCETDGCHVDIRDTGLLLGFECVNENARTAQASRGFRPDAQAVLDDGLTFNQWILRATSRRPGSKVCNQSSTNQGPQFRKADLPLAV